MLEELREAGRPVSKPAAQASTPPVVAGSAARHPVQPVHVSTAKAQAQAPPRPQPKSAPKPQARTAETLTHAIVRMRSQGYSAQQVAGQVRRWHPNLSPAQARSVVRSAANPVAHRSRTAVLPKTAARLASPASAAGNCTPLVQHHHGSLFGAIVGGVEHAGRYSEHEIAKGGHWAVEHPDTIAIGLGVAALAASGPLGIAFELAAGAASAYGAGRAYDRGDYVGAALDLGAVGLGGGAVYARAEETISERLARDSEQEARSLDRSASQATRKRVVRQRRYRAREARANERLYLERRAAYALAGRRVDAGVVALSALGIDPEAIYRNL